MHGTPNEEGAPQSHRGSEASQTCISFKGVWEASKTKKMQDIKCVYVPVCQMYKQP